MTVQKLNPKGQRGSWFAKVDGELLPCVHNHWRKGLTYHDPNARPGETIWDEFIKAIHDQKQVIETTDKVSDPVNGFGFERTGYIGVFDVGDVNIEGNNLTFKFIKRVR